MAPIACSRRAPEIAELLPWSGGIRRGATVAVVGTSSLLLALIAGAEEQRNGK